MTTLPLADGSDFEFSKLWVYAILLALSVIGGIFGKKKQEEQKRQERGSPRVRRPEARSPAPAPPRTPQPPRPPRPTQLERPTARFPEARPARPAPIPVSPRPVRARPGPPMRPPIARPSLRETPIEVEPVLAEVEAAPAELAAPAARSGQELGAAKRPAIRPGVQVKRVRRLLRSKPGLRTAFVLSEILAPPVGLRHNHVG